MTVEERRKLAEMLLGLGRERIDAILRRGGPHRRGIKAGGLKWRLDLANALGFQNNFRRFKFLSDVRDAVRS